MSALWRDTRGAVLIYVTVGLTVLLGGAALVIDVGRLYTMNSQQQAAADSLALACAAELDRTADSETRALAAVTNLVANQDTYSTTAASNITVDGSGPVFLKALPVDSAAITPAHESGDPSETRFCQITVTARSIDTYFVQVFANQSSKSTTATAVAGFDQAVCAFTPLFICNPFEFGDPGTVGASTIEQAVTLPSFRRRLFKLAILGGPDQPSAGNFGFLESPLGPGAAALAQSLAVTAPNTCFTENGVATKTGASTGPVRQAINVRFDMYRGSFNSKKNNADYRPGLNVRRGWSGDPVGSGIPDCMEPDDAVTNTPGTQMGLPRDDCFDATDAAFPCTNLGATDARMGTGMWDFEDYWTTNHAAAAPLGWTDLDPPARYEVYREEIDSLTYTEAAPSGETGVAECYGGGTAPNDDPDRRILYAAVIDCQTEMGPGANTGVPVEAWLKLFISEPVNSVDGDPANTKDAIFIEIVNVLEPGQDSEVLHDIVQLYR